jgi:hypothetical protein
MLISNEHILKFGKLILAKHPGIRAKLLGMAMLASPYVPEYTNGLNAISESARYNYFQLKEMHKWQQQNSRR